MVVEYVYDAYGVPTVSFPGITEGMSDAEKNAIYLLGYNNPFRYRGYYYDIESGLYYLNSRYYDPVTGRFLNADEFVSGVGSDIRGYNLFSYCFNNPINQTDSSGNWPSFIAKAVVATSIAVITLVVVVTMPSKEEHYKRNDYQKDVFKMEAEDIIDSADWYIVNDNQNIYHRHTCGEQGEKAKDNKKYMTNDKKKEVIINFSDPENPTIVTDPYNVGTYNFGTTYIGHFVKDVLPYWLWGNSETDSGWRFAWDRIRGAKD